MKKTVVIILGVGIAALSVFFLCTKKEKAALGMSPATGGGGTGGQSSGGSIQIPGSASTAGLTTRDNGVLSSIIGAGSSLLTPIINSLFNGSNTQGGANNTFSDTSSDAYTAQIENLDTTIPVDLSLPDYSSPTTGDIAGDFSSGELSGFSLTGSN